MIGKTMVSALIVIGTLLSGPAFESVTFKATPLMGGNFLPKLRGDLRKPGGHGPFPAVVLLHGSLGICPYHHTWAERLKGWGYVALLVDSIGSRAYFNPGMEPMDISISELLQDAFDAKRYLEALPFVDTSRIAVMGWEQGGWAILGETNESVWIHNPGSPFQASIAFYPYCETLLNHANSPLLILIGDQDRWCPAKRCRIPIDRKGGHEIILRVFPGAFHAFDAEGINTTMRGHRLVYDPESATDAINQVKSFLAKHLK